MSLLPPGRFLMPGNLAGSPALTFAPLKLGDEGRNIVIFGPLRGGMRVEVAVGALGEAERPVDIECERFHCREI